MILAQMISSPQRKYGQALQPSYKLPSKGGLDTYDLTKNLCSDFSAPQLQQKSDNKSLLDSSDFRRLIAFSTAPHKRALLSDRRGTWEHFTPKKLAVIGLKGSIIAVQPIFFQLANEAQLDDEHEPDWQELFADFDTKFWKAVTRILSVTSLQRFLDILAVRLLPIRTADRLMKDASLSAIRKLKRMNGWQAYFKIAKTYLIGGFLSDISYFIVDEGVLIAKYFMGRRQRQQHEQQSRPRPYIINLFPNFLQGEAKNVKKSDTITGKELWRKTLINVGIYTISPLASSLGFAAGAMLVPNSIWVGQAGSLIGDGLVSFCF